MKRFLHIVLVLLVVTACRGPRVIPKDTLTDIYVDMLMADQFVREENITRNQLDTTLVYEAVFEKYGYDTDDYLHSVRYYLKDPERFAKVFEEVAKRLEGEVSALDKIIEKQEQIAERESAKHPQVDSILAPFSKENVYRGLARAVRDTTQYPYLFHLVAVHEDTLMIPVDSLKANKDTVATAFVVEDEIAIPQKSSIIEETRSRIAFPARERRLKEDLAVEDIVE